MPFKQAVKLPIFLYGKVRFYSLDGTVKIEGPISSRMIKIGSNRSILAGYDKSTAIALFENGTILFKGKADISMGTFLRVSGSLIIGNNIIIGTDCKIICDCQIDLQDEVRIAFQTRIMDTSFHPLINLETKEIPPFKKTIIIGYKSWIASCSHIMPGTKIKNNTIISSNSLINKDFTKYDGEYMILGGIPAKILKTGITRIRTQNIEEDVTMHYLKSPEEIYIYNGEIKE